MQELNRMLNFGHFWCLPPFLSLLCCTVTYLCFNNTQEAIHGPEPCYATWYVQQIYTTQLPYSYRLLHLRVRGKDS